MFGTGLITVLLAATVAQGLVYRGPIFAHYWLAVSPVLFLAVAAGVSMVPHRRLALVATGVGVAALLGVNVWAAPFRQPPEQQLAHSEAVAAAIGAAAAGEPFLIRLASSDESDGAY